jgi:hypothetical protein
MHGGTKIKIVATCFVLKTGRHKAAHETTHSCIIKNYIYRDFNHFTSGLSLYSEVYYTSSIKILC